MTYRTAIVWLRNDLRTRDHEVLLKATNHAERVLPVYFLDPKYFKNGPLGFAKFGAFRAQFLLESISDLQNNLQNIGGDLLVVLDSAENALPALAEKIKAEAIFFHKEIAPEEVATEKSVAAALAPKNIRLHPFSSSHLFHPSDLPFAIANLPEIFTHFRKKVEKHCEVRPPLPAPKRVLLLEHIEIPPIPTLHSIGLDPPEKDERQIYPFVGGESAALARLDEYFFRTHRVAKYKETRNGLLGDYSSKFSPWLAAGNISARFIFQQLKKYEREHRKNSSTYWLFFELVWRDYFRCLFAKHRSAYFLRGGIRGQAPAEVPDAAMFEKWKAGETGQNFIDANMKEISKTGWMSNRGRQNVASFLVHDLHLPWRWGAAYFESALIDYDVHSNWGNWAYVAGVGNDPRVGRAFNPAVQSERYDAGEEYVRTWLPAGRFGQGSLRF